MRAIDTNVLVRLITRDNARHAAEAERYVGTGAWVSHLVLAETAWVLASVYGLGDAEVAQAMEMLLENDRITVQEADVARRAVVLMRTKAGVSFSDCLILEIARQAGHLPLGTFDRRLGHLAGAERVQ